MKMSVSARGLVIANFALTHFEAAKQHSARARQIEDGHCGNDLGNYLQEVAIPVSSTILCAVASLEALINEMFLHNGPLRSNINNFDEAFWGDKGIEREPILEKYQIALDRLDRDRIPRGCRPYQPVKALVDFRDYLVHFKPLVPNRNANQSLMQQLTGQFELSPHESTDDFGTREDHFLTKRCMSAGCSSWAVNSVTNFIMEFAEVSEIFPNKLRSFTSD